MNEPREALPPIWKSELDPAGCDALFVDLEQVEMLGVVLRGGPRDMAPDPTKTSLSDARAALGAGSAVQLRYRWEGQEWWDTLTPRQSGVVALVRIRHPLGVAESSPAEALVDVLPVRLALACKEGVQRCQVIDERSL